MTCHVVHALQAAMLTTLTHFFKAASAASLPAARPLLLACWDLAGPCASHSSPNYCDVHRPPHCCAVQSRRDRTHLVAKMTAQHELPALCASHCCQRRMTAWRLPGIPLHCLLLPALCTSCLCMCELLQERQPGGPCGAGRRHASDGEPGAAGGGIRRGF